MSELDAIFFIGMPGSGTSRLCRSLVERLPPQTAEHISLGDRVREIGHGALSLHESHVFTHLNSDHPEARFTDDVTKGLVEEVLEKYPETELTMVDGYPLNNGQVFDAFAISERLGRLIRGLIVTRTDRETAKTRMIKRSERPISDTMADRRIEQYLETEAGTLGAVEGYGLPITYINTTGRERSVTTMGLRAVKTMLAQQQETAFR